MGHVWRARLVALLRSIDKKEKWMHSQMVHMQCAMMVKDTLAYLSQWGRD